MTRQGMASYWPVIFCKTVSVTVRYASQCRVWTHGDLCELGQLAPVIGRALFVVGFAPVVMT